MTSSDAGQDAVAGDQKGQTAPPRPVALTFQPEQVPEVLKELRRFVCWRYTWKNGNGKPGKWDKPPFIATSPERHASSTDPKTWRTFAQARTAVALGQFDGLGLVVGRYAGLPEDVAAGDRLGAFDLDHCVEPDGTIAPWAAEVIRRVESYTEYSPSGSGIRIWFFADGLPVGGNKRGDFEVFTSGKYLTVTGHHVAGTPRTVEERTEVVAAIHAAVFVTADQPSRPASHLATVATLADEELLARARAAVNGAAFSALWAGDSSAYGGDDSSADLALCNHLAYWTGRDASRMDALFRQSGLMRPKWDQRRGARTYGERTISKAVASCREVYEPRRSGTIGAPAGSGRDTATAEPSGEASLILDPADPLPSARAFVAARATSGGRLALRHYAGVFYAHDPVTAAYAGRDEAAVRADLYGFLEVANRLKDGKLASFQPTKARVENVLDALRAVCNVPAACAAPCWLEDDPGLDPHDVLPLQNGLLHIPTRQLWPPTPAFFALNGLPFAFDPAAPEPVAWLAFLSELWPDDPESCDTLQEWIGYLLTADTSFQKIGMVVGPKRSGKGTIGRVIRRLLGERNVCAPTLASLSDPFGLSVLIGKMAAIIADARIGGRADTAVVTERLLSISGEDGQTVQRKYLPDWNGTLPTRFLLLTNELPRIEDASGALASRFVLLTLSRSFYGQEDHRLLERFLPELPGILNWALAGRDRLYARGRFVQPASSADLIQQFEDLGSPVSAFGRDRLELGAGFQVPLSDLFQAWRTWCSENGLDRPGTVQTFGKHMAAAYPWLRRVQHRAYGVPVRHWMGVRLRE